MEVTSEHEMTSTFSELVKFSCEEEYAGCPLAKGPEEVVVGGNCGEAGGVEAAARQRNCSHSPRGPAVYGRQIICQNTVIFLFLVIFCAFISL